MNEKFTTRVTKATKASKLSERLSGLFASPSLKGLEYSLGRLLLS